MSDRVTKALAVMTTEGEQDRWGSDAYEIAAWAAWNAMSGGEQEALDQLLFKGPVWDGDVISKEARDALLSWGLAVRCCVKGEQGYTAASYRAYHIFKIGTNK